MRTWMGSLLVLTTPLLGCAQTAPSVGPVAWSTGPQVFDVTANDINRIVTPFADPRIVTTSTAEIERSQNVLYVLPEDSEPITMFITETGQETPSINLVLHPKLDAPREIRLAMPGRDPLIQTAAAIESPHATTSAAAQGGTNGAPHENLLVAEILFEHGSAEVTPGGRAALERAATRIRELQTTSIQVTGFSDRTGSEEVNLRLSERRLDNVITILESLDVQAPITAMAKGETMLPYPTEDGVPEPNNRKVAVFAVDTGGTKTIDVDE